ncbi:MAG: hypothetical protein P8Z78_05715 [Gammaproteobacteria bacterium]
MIALATTAAVANPADDLRVSFSSKRTGDEAGRLVGSIANTSVKTYRCILAVFDLNTRFDKRKPGEASRHLGYHKVRINNLAPRSTRNFDSRLPYPAGIGFHGFEGCKPVVDERHEAPVNQPVENRYCNITGEVRSATGFEGYGDRGEKDTIEMVYLLKAGTGKLFKQTRLGRKIRQVRDNRTGQTYQVRDYAFRDLPSTGKYEVRLSSAWKTRPDKVLVSCPDGRGKYKFKVAPIKHAGNRLGG